MSRDKQIVDAVGRVYEFIDSQLEGISVICDACGKCCDFARYDHRLYVTSAEMMYFRETIGADNIKPMSEGRCPYNVDGKCRVHKDRFAGCRTFYCKGDSEFQSSLAESAIREFKKICEDFDLPYFYADLAKALG
jgi:Fe-S-cluster containining protein